MDAFRLLVHMMREIAPGAVGGRIIMSGVHVSYTKHSFRTRPHAPIRRQFG
jgi:hypothetical protein